MQTDYVADTWQEWDVTYALGVPQHFDSRLEQDPTRVVFDIAKSGEPLSILIEFKVELKRSLRTGNDGGKWDNSFHWWWSTPWQEILRGEPLVTVLVDFRPAESELSLAPLVFTGSESKVGASKSWKSFIIFSGNPSQPADASVIHLESALAGKSSAAIQIINTQTWFLTQFYYSSLITGDPSPFTSERSRIGVASPYGLNFNWMQGQAGSGTFSWPTMVISTDSTGIVLIQTVTGTQIVTLFTYLNGTRTVYVTGTLVGPTVTVTQVIATNRPTTGGSEDGKTVPKAWWEMVMAWLKSLMPARFEELWWLLGLILLIVAVIVLAVILKILRWALGGKKKP